MANVSSITAQQLHAVMNSGQEAFILDVRNKDEFSSWKIEGHTTKSINVPYFNFLEEDESNYNDLPKDRDIVVVCAKGGSAQFVAGLLADKGHRATVLEGGMLSWSQFYYPTVIASHPSLTLIQINRLSKGCLSYVIVSKGKAMVLDPGHLIGIYTELAKEHRFTIEHIVDSHLHADHISGGRALAELTGATYYISSGEVDGTDLHYEPLENHASIRFGQAEVDVLAIPTPGHTPGSTSFLLNNAYLMSGDTIFVGGLGRPDLGGKPKEWAEDLYDTVFHKVSKLSDDVLVLPAHYADISEMNEDGIVAATLGHIRTNNDIMTSADREAFTEQVAGAADTEKPPNFEEIVAINRGEQHVAPERAAELEIGPNRCAVHHH